MTTIGPLTTVEGRIEGDEDLNIEGRVVGSVALTQTLFVAQNGAVDGTIHAKGVRIDGTVDGDVTATEFIHLTASARVRAKLAAPIIRMDDGALLRGDIEMDVDGPVPVTRSVASKPVARVAPVARPVATPAPVKPTPQVAPAVTPAPAQAATTHAAATTTTVVVEEAEPTADLSEYDAMTVKELRDRLKDYDLPVSGTKQELMERLAEADR
ncbi:MAG: polymer-forming cytoskeletal protein [bacterium]